MTYSVKSKQNAVIYNHLEAHCRENESRPLHFNAFRLSEKSVWPRLKQAVFRTALCAAPQNNLCLLTVLETN